MLKKLKAEMVLQDITVLEVSKKTGIRYQTLLAKIAEESPITIPEARKIRDAVNPAKSIDELFDDEEA